MSVISDVKMILKSNNIHLLHDAKSYLEQIERWDAIKDADLVEVVRCKDCKHYSDRRCQMIIGIDDRKKDNDYCSYGERRKDAT